MTTKNEQASTTQEETAAQKTAEELAQEKSEREEQAGFDVGFAEVRGSEPPAGAKKTVDDAAVEAAAEETSAAEGTTTTTTEGASTTAPASGAAAVEAPKDAWEGVHPQVRKMLEGIQSEVGSVAHLAKTTAGRVGNLQSAVDAGRKAASAAGGEQPSPGEVALAIADPAAWKAFEEEFPDFAKPVKAQFEAMHKQLAKKSAAPAVDVGAISKQVLDTATPSFQSAVAEAEERAYTRLKFPDYKKTVKTPEFKAWFDTQPSEMKAKADSAMADDAIAMLGAFDAHQTAQRAAAAAAAEKKAKQEQRLRAAASPNGTGAPVRGAPTEEDAFQEGFHAVRPRR